MENNEFSKQQSTVNDAKQMGKNIAHEAKQMGEEIAHDAKQMMTETMEEAKGQVKTAFSDQKEKATEGLNNVAGALRRTSQELSSEENQTFAQYADAAADQVERISGYLQNREVGDLLGDLRDVARRQPELFVAGALAAGFLVGRFLKSSSAQSTSGYQGGQNYQYGNYGQQSPTYGSQYSSEYGTAQYGATPNSSSAYGATWESSQPSMMQDIPIAEGEEQYGR